MTLKQLLEFAEHVTLEARRQRNDPNLRPIERIAAATRVAGRLARAYGRTVWVEGTVRRLVDRGETRFEAPATPGTTTRPADVVLPIVDVIMETDTGEHVVIQMIKSRAEREVVSQRAHFAARFVRMRRTGERRWDVWLRHSRIPRRLDRWLPSGGFPDYRDRITGSQPSEVVGAKDDVTRINVAVP
jgi:hypothetical protein